MLTGPLLALLPLPAAVPFQEARDVDWTGLEEELEAIVLPEALAGRFSGVVLVAEDGEVLFEQAYGLADEASERENALDTRFLIFSTTKQLTATAVMKLVADGRLSLDDSVRTYLPEAPESWQPVTVHHLLTHTSGIPDRVDDLLAHYDGDDQATLAAVIAQGDVSELTAEPGASWGYSNFGYQVLLVVLERVAGQPYSELLDELVFDAAGMDASGTIAPAHPEGTPRGCEPVPGLATGYNGSPDALAVANPLMYVNLGAGGVYSTARDLLRFDDLLRKGELLDCDTQRIMLDRGHELRDGVRYGYGWITRRLDEEIVTFEHSGGTNGYTSQYLRIPRLGLCVVVLSNLGFAPVGELATSIRDVLLARAR
jgi:CubicO group peptidase (beta-lactamase class C family)